MEAPWATILPSKEAGICRKKEKRDRETRLAAVCYRHPAIGTNPQTHTMLASPEAPAQTKLTNRLHIGGTNTLATAPRAPRPTTERDIHIYIRTASEYRFPKQSARKSAR